MERVKSLAAGVLGELEIDMQGHKIVATKEAFGNSSVYTTMADDGAVLFLSGEVMDPAVAGKKLSISAQALCSPSTKKYELMTTGFQSK